MGDNEEEDEGMEEVVNNEEEGDNEDEDENDLSLIHISEPTRPY